MMTHSFSISLSLSFSSDHLEQETPLPHLRSLSVPCLLTPNLFKIQQQLKNLNSSSSPSMDPQALEWVSSKLISLSNLYLSLEDLISFPSTQQSLLRHGHGRLVEQALEASITFLGAVSTIQDLGSSMKDRLGDLQSSRRRRAGGEGERCGVSSYVGFRKSSNKEIAVAARELKLMMKKRDDEMEFDVVIGATDCEEEEEKEDLHLGMVSNVLREIAATTAGVLQSMLSSFSIPVERSKAKRQLRIFMSKIGVKRTMDSSSQGFNRWKNVIINEVGSVDLALFASDDMGTVQGRMRTLEIGLQKIEGSLDGVSRSLLQYRVSFLNMLAN